MKCLWSSKLISVQKFWNLFIFFVIIDIPDELVEDPSCHLSPFSKDFWKYFHECDFIHISQAAQLTQWSVQDPAMGSPNVSVPLSLHKPQVFIQNCVVTPNSIPPLGKSQIPQGTLKTWLFYARLVYVIVTHKVFWKANWSYR